MSLLSLTSARWTWGVLCWGDRLTAGFADVLQHVPILFHILCFTTNIVSRWVFCFRYENIFCLPQSRRTTGWCHQTIHSKDEVGKKILNYHVQSKFRRIWKYIISHLHLFSVYFCLLFHFLYFLHIHLFNIRKRFFLFMLCQPLWNKSSNLGSIICYVTICWPHIWFTDAMIIRIFKMKFPKFFHLSQNFSWLLLEYVET